MTQKMVSDLRFWNCKMFSGIHFPIVDKNTSLTLASNGCNAYLCGTENQKKPHLSWQVHKALIQCVRTMFCVVMEV